MTKNQQKNNKKFTQIHIVVKWVIAMIAAFVVDRFCLVIWGDFFAFFLLGVSRHQICQICTHNFSGTANKGQ